MADVVAAFGIAANVIQFLDFGSRLTAAFWSFYKASRAGKEIIPDLNNITKDLQTISSSLASSPNNGSETDKSLNRLATECHGVAKELLALLATLGRTEISNRGRLDAIKTAFKHIWKEDEVVELRTRLEGFRSELSLHLLASLRYVSITLSNPSADERLLTGSVAVFKLRKASSNSNRSFRISLLFKLARIDLRAL